MRDITDEDFQRDLRESTDPFVIFFSASWCGPCTQLKKAVRELSESMKGDVDFYLMDIEQSPETSSHYQIRNLPSLALFSDGMIRDIMVGNQTKTNVRLWIQENI